MKKKRGWIIASFALLIASLLCACGKHEADGTWQFDETYHWQNCEKSDGHTYEKSAHEYAANGANKKCAVCGKEVDYTEEENALYWIEGRDGTIGYAGIYTIDFTEETIGKDGEKEKNATRESWGMNGKYFCMRDRYVAAAGEEYVSDGGKTCVLKSVLDGGTRRTKYFQTETDENGETQKAGSYVSPSYIDEEDLDYPPDKQIEDYGIEEGKDRVGLISGIEKALEEEGIEAPAITFTRNPDHSVTLKISCFYETEETDDDTGESYNVASYIDLYLIAKDGKIVGITDDFRDEAKYEDSAKNFTEKYTRTKKISYEFAQSEYDSIDISTDVTPNMYYAAVSVRVENYDRYFIYTDSLVGETVTRQTLIDYINAATVYFLIGNDENEQLFELYADEAMTIPFTSLALEKEEYEVYFKFVLPEDKAIVLAVFKEEREDKIVDILRLAYVWDVGERFYPRERFRNYIVLSADGKEVTDCSSFVCEENRVYAVTYDGKYYENPPEVNHGALEEWSYDENAHWHGCRECPNHHYDWEIHLFEEKDGQSVCSVCKAVKKTTPAETSGEISG